MDSQITYNIFNSFSRNSSGTHSALSDWSTKLGLVTMAILSWAYQLNLTFSHLKKKFIDSHNFFQKEVSIEIEMNGVGNEEDSSYRQDQICCLVDGGERCSRLAGNAAYNKRIQRLVSQRKLRLHSDSSVSMIVYILFRSASHSYICEHHKSVIQSVRVKRKRRESEDDSGDIEEQPEAELFNLQ
ncbi:Histone deacetylase complex subunit SAP30-like protein, partial [Armadillidium vulgare]